MNARTLALFGVIAFFFFGCVTIDYSQKVDRDGGSVVTQTIDFSSLQSAIGSQGTAQVGDPCQNLTKTPGVNCTYSNYVITLSKTFRATDGAYTFTKSFEFPNIVYTLQLKKLPMLVQPSSSEMSTASINSEFNSSASKLSASTLKTMGAKITYLIEMPGEIYVVENGQLNNGKAQYDVVSLMSEGQDVLVKSKELDITSLAMIGGVIVLLIGGVVVAAVLFKASKK